MYRNYIQALFIFLIFSAQTLYAQVTLTVRVNSGNSATTCTDGFLGGAPEPHWRVEVAGQGYTTYPVRGLCFTNPPNTQYSQTFDCANAYPANLQVCFRAFEDDGVACLVSESCLQQICQNFPTPAPGSSSTFTLSIPAGSSSGSVNFTITATGAFTLPGAAFDQICNAVNLGTLPSGASVGNDGLSNLGNFCATNTAEPNPWGGGSNQQGVWFRFTTGPNPAATIRFNANSDPQNLGDGLDLQIALFSSSNGTCTGALNLIRQEQDGIGIIWDEEMFVDCLQPNTTYFLLVDGENSFLTGSNGQQGFFGLEIYDNGITQAGDLICNAQHIGTVPAGGSVGTPNLSQTNICATNTADPNPGNWSSDKTVWFSFITPPSGHVIIDAESDLPFPIGNDAVDLQVALYSTSNNTCTGVLNNIDSDYTPGLFDETLDVRCLDPNRRYWILIDGSGLNVDGIFDVTVSDGGIPPAPNDSICNAIPLGAPVPNGTVGLNNQNNYCADNLFEPIPSNFGNDQGVWYTFVAPPSGKVEIRLESAGFFSDRIDLQVAVYDALNMGCADPLTEIHSEYEGFGLLWDETAEVECLIPGRTYYIMVDGQGSLINPDLQEGIFDIEVWADPRDPAGPNDLPCNAIALGNPTGGQIGTTPGPAHGSQNNFCATAAGEPNPGGFNPDQSVWYTFVAPATGNVEIIGTSDAIFGGVDAINLEIAVWESTGGAGCAGPWREIISGDDLLGFDTDLDVFCLEPGQTYWVQVDGAPPAAIIEGHEGYFDIRIRELPAIPVAINDLICNAIPLGNPFSGTSSAANQNNLCADDIGDPDPADFDTDQTVWYTFTTPATGGPYAVDVSTTTGLPWPFGSGSIDLQVAVYASSNNTCTGSLTEIDSEYDPFFFDEEVRVQCLLPNTTYFVMVDGSFIDPQGYFDISITPAPSVPIPTNDLICSFEDLGTVPIGGSINNNVNYSNFCADTEPNEPSVFGIDQTVWFSFIAPLHTGANTTSEVTVRVESDPNNVGDLVDLQLAVYESATNSCTGPFSLVRDGSDDPTFSFDAEVNTTCLVPGRRYFVQVDGSILNIEGYFTIRVEDDGSGFHPPYDTICNAVALGAVPNGGAINNGVVYTNLCATVQAGEPDPDAFNINQTVWFTFTAPASGNVTVDLFSNSSDNINLQVAIYQAQNNACAGPFLEIDSDHDGLLSDESITLECLIPNQLYFMQVDGSGSFGGDEGNFTIRIEDDGGTTIFPYNNDICNAHNFGVPSGSFTTLSNETNECANVQFGEPGLGGYADHTVWYQFTAPPSGRVDIEVVSTNLLTGLDPEVHVFASGNNGCTGSLNQIESSTFPTALITEEIEAVCLVPGNTYFIQVDGSGIVQEGTFNIRIRDMFPLYGTGAPGDPEPANNLCANATPIPVQPESCANGNGSWNMYNYGYPTAEQSTGCGQNCGEIWYSFTMPSTGIALIEGNDDGIGSGFPFGDFSDLRVVAYTGSCGNLTQVGCGSGGFTNDVGFEIAAAPGATVFLQVFNQGGDDDNEDFELCVSEGCGADNCLNAMAFPIQPNIPYCFNTAAAGGENVSGGTPGYFECGEGDNPEHSIYYYFVSDCNGSAVTLNVINAVASGGCLLGTIPDDGFNISFFQDVTPCDNAPGSLVDCQNFNSCMIQPINWSFTYSNLLPNTPYIIQIDGGFNFLGGDNSGYIMIQTTTNPVVLPTSTPATCSGGGTATATTVGGVAPFTFLWSNGATDSIATNLTPGTYTVTVTSAGGLGCFDTATVVIASPVLMNASVTGSTDPLCANNCNGSASANATGGTVILGYLYQWSANTGSQTTQTATGLCQGTYTVTVFDNGGCFATAQVTIGPPPPAVLASVVSTVDARCSGICDGEGTVSAVGGIITTDYAYLWPSGATTAFSTGLCAGAYVVTVSDRNGCADTVSLSINQPLSVTGSIANQTNVDCNANPSGSVEIFAINGTAPYSFNIGSGFVASNTFINLSAGNYTVTVQDVNGCSDTIGLIISEPLPLAVQLISTIDESCFGAADGQLTASAAAGTAPYEFSIDGINFFSSAVFNNLAASAYTVTVRDSSGCTAFVPAAINAPLAVNIAVDGQTASGCGVCTGTAAITASGGAGGYTYVWTNGQTIQDATALCSGTNFVTVTDANGCSASVSVAIGNVSGLLANASVTEPSCFGNCNGQVSVSPTGGTAPFTFIWTNGQTGTIATGLCLGAYAVTVTDINGCFAVENVIVNEPAELTALAAELQAVSCNGNSDGEAIATPSGGTSPYSYVWDNGETTQNAAALNAGGHTVTVNDANSCSVTAVVTITEPAAFAVSIVNTTNSDCGPSTCNGSAQISVSGGAAPYSYLWSNGTTTAAPTNLCPNFNDITVTDASGCTATAAVNIPSNSTLGLSLNTQVNPLCFGNCNGSASVTASGGNTTLPYTFTWSNGAATNGISALCAGSYRVTVSDVDACTNALEVTITEPSELQVTATVSSNYNGEDVSCFGAANGALALNVVGGTSAYNFIWSNGRTTQNISGIGAAAYTVTVTDANNCSTTAAITVTQPTAVTVTALVTSDYNGNQISCFGASDGTAQATAAGGTGTIGFVWSNALSSDIATGLSSGVYTVTATDLNACPATASVTVTQPTAVSVTSVITNVSCFGGNNGAVNISVSGGQAAYTFLWSNAATTEDISGLSAAVYTVTVTDLNGCSITRSVTVTEPSLLTATSTQTNISCFGGTNGAVNLTISGGVNPYSFNWSNGVTTEDISALAFGTYTVTVSDANSCTVVNFVTLTQPTILNASTTQINISCFGGSNGSVNLTVGGGQSPYSFSWSNGRITEDISGLSIGTYTVTVSDANGCITVTSATLTQPALLTASTNGTNISCFGGSNGAVNLTVAGGTIPYTYNWSNGRTTEDISGLTVGTFAVTVTDANACATVTSATITQPTALALSIANTDVTCRFGANGTVNTTVSGGVLPYTYQWSNGATTASLNNVSSGTYLVTVTDANACIITGSTFIIQPATSVVANVLSTINVSCFGASTGVFDADALGGTPNYTFLWSNGATTQDLSGIPAGTYSMTATDQVGCTATVTTTIAQPIQLLGTVIQYSNYNGSAITCAGASDGAVRVSASGGVGPYTFIWSTTPAQNTQLISGLNAGIYTVSIIDANGCQNTRSITLNDPLPLQTTFQQVNVSCFGNCNGQIIANAVTGTGTLGINGYEYRIFGPGQTGSVFSNINNFTNLCPGNYVVEVRDGNNCTIALNITITEPAVLAVNAIATAVSCNGQSNGTATATVSGGTTPYSFVWSNGQSTASISALVAGNYTVTVTDANNCRTIANINIAEPTVLAATVTVTPPSCNGSPDASATAIPTGGTAPYTYLWSNGTQLQQTFGLAAGIHSVTITDASGCVAVRSFSVTYPTVLTATFSGINLGCFGVSNGSATVNPAGGTAPYTYLWNNGQTTSTATGLTAGIVSVLVSDFRGCQTIAFVTISQPSMIAAALISTTNVNCNGGNDGTATVAGSGGTAPYSFIWSNGQTTATATGLAIGSYTVTVSDINGCSTSTVANILQPSQALITGVTQTSVSCKGGNNGTASVAVNLGGTFPYDFVWSNGGTGQSVNNLTAGTYFVTLTDGNGCQSNSQVIVTEPASALMGYINTNAALCNGAASGQITAVISGGTLPSSGEYNYIWSNGATTAVVSGVTAGNYSVTVTDANGCTLSISTVVNQAGSVTMSLVSTINALCAGGTDGRATVVAFGGTGTIVYQWSNGQNTPTVTGLSAGVYTVTASDDNGCSQSITVTVGEGAAVEITTAITNVSCFGDTNGRLEVTSSGASLYFWSNGQIGNPLANLGAGQYTLTVEMANGCRSSFIYNVAEPAELELSLSQSSGIACNNGNNGSLSTTVVGGTPNYTYNWSNGANTAAVSNLTAGTYNVTVTDTNGCTTADQISLANPNALGLELSGVDARCFGDLNGRIQVSGNGGTTATGSYQYSIDSVTWQTGDLFPGLGVGMYTVYVLDANGCVREDSILIEASDPFTITFFTPTDTTIEYGDTITLAAMVSDTNNAIVSWWDLNANNLLAENVYELIVAPSNKMVYEFRAVSPLGCESDTTVRITVIKPRRAAAPAGFTPNGDGVNDNFFVQGDDKVAKVLVFRVFDRWGEMIYEGTDLDVNNPQQGWDGTFKGVRMNSGVYAWYAEVEYIDGFKEVLRGDVTLLR